MNLRRLVILVLSILVVVGLTLPLACAKPAPAPSPAPAPPPAPTPAAKPWPKAIIITTPAVGGGLHIYGSTLAGMIERNTKVVVTPQPTTGGQEAQELFAKGEAQMWATNGYDVLLGYTGDRPKDYTPATARARWFAGAYLSWVHFVVRADSGIKTFADLKGKRCMFDRPGAPLWWEVFPRVLKAYGLTEKDIVVMPALAYREAAQALTERTADATQQYSAIPNPQFLEMALKVPIHLLPIEKEKQAEILKAIPFESIGTIPGGTYKGTLTDTPALNLVAPIGIDANLPDDFAYAAIKAIVERFGELEVAHAMFKGWKPIDLAADPIIPYHAGVFKYYKEAGLMKPEWEQKHFDMLKMKNQAK